MNVTHALGSRTRAAAMTVFALLAALAVCVVMLFWTPLEAPASWRAANQTSGSSELF